MIPCVQLVLLLQVFATLFMLGVVWFVQLVHYPLLHDVGVKGFKTYHLKHTMRTLWVVSFPMVLEFFTGLTLLFISPKNVPYWVLCFSMLLIVINSLSTALIQIPLHKKLEKGFNSQTIDKLIKSNWLRVAIWSLRGLIVLYMVA
jgi:hypothetical protein